MRSYVNNLVLVLSLLSLVSCGGGNDVASGVAGTGVTSASAVAGGAPNGAASTLITSTKAAMDSVGFTTVPAASILKVAYVDATATGSFSAIESAGLAAPDIVIYGFVITG